MTSFLNQLAGLIIDGKRNKGEPHKVRPYIYQTSNLFLLRLAQAKLFLRCMGTCHKSLCSDPVCTDPQNLSHLQQNHLQLFFAAYSSTICSRWLAAKIVHLQRPLAATFARRCFVDAAGFLLKPSVSTKVFSTQRAKKAAETRSRTVFDFYVLFLTLQRVQIISN